MSASVEAERNLISCKMFLASHFSSFIGMKVPREKQSYEDMPRVHDSIGAASALLASASMPSSS